MSGQTFVVTLETVTPFEEDFPKVAPERMADIIRNAVQTGCCLHPVPLPFQVIVEAETEEIASTWGHMRGAYPRDPFEEAEQASTWGE